MREEESLCMLLGIDLEQKVQELLHQLQNKDSIANQKFKITNSVASNSEQLLPFSPSEMFNRGSSDLSFHRFQRNVRESMDNTPIWHAKVTPIFGINIKPTDLKCDEEIIPDTKELDEELDQIGDTFRTKMDEYRA